MNHMCEISPRAYRGGKAGSHLHPGQHMYLPISGNWLEVCNDRARRCNKPKPTPSPTNLPQNHLVGGDYNSSRSKPHPDARGLWVVHNTAHTDAHLRQLYIYVQKDIHQTYPMPLVLLPLRDTALLANLTLYIC